MKILITGGAGYVGTQLTKVLSASPETTAVILFDNLSRANYNLFLGRRFENPEKITFVSGDLLDSRKLRQVLQQYEIDVVYHLAARVTTPFANTEAHFHEQINHWGTSELVMAVEESNVKRFIYTSSTSVYGASVDLIDEDAKPDPKTFYGTSKLRGEQHVKRLMDKMDTYILRCGNVYGYNKSMRFDAVINRFMFDANFNNRISIHGDGKQSRAFIHIDLLAEILSKSLSQKIPSGIYNVVDKNLQILDIVDVVKEIFPELEFIFINQHLKLRDLKVNPESRLRLFIDYTNEKTFKEEMVEFKQRFCF
ncbi:MAG: NAD-dependent epimerase/dehydratase family protein [bacterium]